MLIQLTIFLLHGPRRSLPRFRACRLGVPCMSAGPTPLGVPCEDVPQCRSCPVAHLPARIQERMVEFVAQRLERPSPCQDGLVLLHAMQTKWHPAIT